jgi:hypothetical protein
LFDPLPLLHALIRHRVDFVMIGGVAMFVLGSTRSTFDLDICYARHRENIQRLVAALQELDARLRGFPADLPQFIDERTFRLGDPFTFTTPFGDLHCLGNPSGTMSYRDLIETATPMELADGSQVPVASIDDLIRMKRAANRDKDQPALRELDVMKRLGS